MDRLGALASVAFLTLCLLWLDSASAQGVEAVDNTSDCILAINLARSGSLNEQVQQLSEDPALAKAAIEDLRRGTLVYTDAPTENTCQTNPGATPAAVGGLLLVANSNEKPNANAIAALIQNQITEGLAQIGDNYSSKFDIKLDPYKGNVAAQNLAYLLFSRSGRVGCAAASNCSAGNSVVVCKLEPTLQIGKAVPFSKELLDALKARQNAGADNSKSDSSGLNTPLPPLFKKSIGQDTETHQSNPIDPHNQTDPNNPENSESLKKPDSAKTPSLSRSNPPYGSAVLGAAGVLMSLLCLTVNQ